MRKSLSSLLLSLCILVSCNGGKDASQVPFDLSSSVLVSEPENMMSHGSAYAIAPDGTAYVMYQGDKTQMQESGEILSIEMKLVSFPIKKWRNKDAIERYTVINSSEKVGDFEVAGGHCPADACIHIQGDTVICMMEAGAGGDNRYVVRYFDARTKKMSDYVDLCSFSYTIGDSVRTVPMSRNGLAVCYKDLGYGDPQNLETPILSKRFVSWDGSLYNVLAGWCCPQSRPLVLETEDFVNYRLAFACPEFERGCVEPSMQIVDGEFYIQARTARKWDSSERGTYMGKYSADGTCLVKPYRTGEIESRPELFVHNGKLYDICNVKPNYVDSEGRQIYRSHVRVAQIDRNANTVRAWDMTSPYGLHYYCVEEYDGQLYMSFTEDVLLRNIKQCKGDIGFCEVNLP